MKLKRDFAKRNLKNRPFPFHTLFLNLRPSSNYKTKSATIAFFLFSSGLASFSLFFFSFPFPMLV